MLRVVPSLRVTGIPNRTKFKGLGLEECQTCSEPDKFSLPAQPAQGPGGHGGAAALRAAHPRQTYDKQTAWLPEMDHSLEFLELVFDDEFKPILEIKAAELNEGDEPILLVFTDASHHRDFSVAEGEDGHHVTDALTSRGEMYAIGALSLETWRGCAGALCASSASTALCCAGLGHARFQYASRRSRVVRGASVVAWACGAVRASIARWLASRLTRMAASAARDGNEWGVVRHAWVSQVSRERVTGVNASAV